MIAVSIVGVGISLRSDALDLKHVDDREEADKEQEKEYEETYRTDKESDIDPGGRKVTPGGGEKVAMNGGDDNNESFEPHPCVREHHDSKYDPRVLAAVLKPEKLRSGDVAGDHRPVRPPVRAKSAIGKGVDLERVATVPSDKELHRVCVTDKGSSKQDDLAHVVDMLVGDEVVKVVNLAERDEKGENHGETTKDGAGNEVRREDGGVPTRNDGGREIEGNDAVHR